MFLKQNGYDLKNEQTKNQTWSLKKERKNWKRKNVGKYNIISFSSCVLVEAKILMCLV